MPLKIRELRLERTASDEKANKVKVDWVRGGKLRILHLRLGHRGAASVVRHARAAPEGG
eukprot:CAMPEP_0118859540 /NCGR_PEP_ID=MMETSP1163-20130328/5749_1 /TAXON_ID=124430 /ORGANISM="Phaeomonas parva, Strain CCMP2877" /LENGTH=58 /DNA_ID=CAMNT_0006793147 /DNA_START=90 /DNA_END=266 /DNA_ORIENTATION=+